MKHVLGSLKKRAFRFRKRNVKGNESEETSSIQQTDKNDEEQDGRLSFEWRVGAQTSKKRAKQKTIHHQVVRLFFVFFASFLCWPNGRTNATPQNDRKSFQTPSSNTERRRRGENTMDWTDSPDREKKIDRMNVVEMRVLKKGETVLKGS